MATWNWEPTQQHPAAGLHDALSETGRAGETIAELVDKLCDLASDVELMSEGGLAALKALQVDVRQVLRTLAAYWDSGAPVYPDSEIVTYVRALLERIG